MSDSHLSLGLSVCFLDYFAPDRLFLFFPINVLLVASSSICWTMSCIFSFLVFFDLFMSPSLQHGVPDPDFEKCRNRIRKFSLRSDPDPVFLEGGIWIRINTTCIEFCLIGYCVTRNQKPFMANFKTLLGHFYNFGHLFLLLNQ